MVRLAVTRCVVRAQVALGWPYFLTDIEAPDIARDVAPGQFVMVRVPGVGDPLLGRPFSVFAVVPATATEPARISLLYNEVGRGTRLISQMRAGDELAVLGPLGRPFSVPAAAEVVLLIAGGIGIAGLHLIAADLRSRGITTRLLYGARQAQDLVTVERFEQLGVEVRLATDDGSRGSRGFVTALVEQALLESPAADTRAYVCGPSVMMRRVRELTLAAGVDTELSLEARMGCGFGVCLGCVVPSATLPGQYRLVCKDGPCMNAHEVIP